MFRRVAVSNDPPSDTSSTETTSHSTDDTNSRKASDGSRWDVARNNIPQLVRSPETRHMNAELEQSRVDSRRNALPRPTMAHVVEAARRNVKKDISNLFSNVKKDVENASTGRLVVWILLVYALGLIIFFFWVPNAPETFGLEPTKVSYADGFYYWATLTSTVGFGDICPKTVGAKIATGIYQVIMVLISAGAVALIADKKMKKYFKLLDLKEKFSRNSVSQ